MKGNIYGRKKNTNKWPEIPLIFNKEMTMLGLATEFYV
jgi:hypothetical protein